MKEVKYIDMKEFREKGYLQEVNRRALHPVGLALEITVFDRWSGFRYLVKKAFKLLFKGEEKEIVTGVWDYREDVMGIYYGFSNTPETNKTQRRAQALIKKMNFENEILKRKLYREELFGDVIEPIESKNDEKIT